MAGVRRVVVEVVAAKGLMPKDGQGSANAYCVVRSVRRIYSVELDEVDRVCHFARRDRCLIF